MHLTLSFDSSTSATGNVFISYTNDAQAGCGACTGNGSGNIGVQTTNSRPPWRPSRAPPAAGNL